MFGLKYCEGANSGKRKRELVKIDDEKKEGKIGERIWNKKNKCLATVGQKTESGWHMMKKIQWY